MNRDQFNNSVKHGVRTYWRTAVAVLSIAFMAVEVLQSFPYSVALRQASLPLQNQIDNLGLYGRTWAMFAATNTNTSSVTLLMTYEDGTTASYQYLSYKPGYLRTAWNEVMQNIQFDSTNDTQGLYKAGFLRFTCDHPPIGTALPQSLQLLQDRTYFTASDPSYHATTSAIIGSYICRP